MSSHVRFVSTMATNEVTPGPTGRYAVEAVKRLRAERRWSLADLSERLTEVGRPILATGLHRLENGKRRVDVDDLMGLAAAFEVTPITLLLPTVPKGALPEEVPVARITETISVDAYVAWDWIRGERPLTGVDEDDDGYELLTFRRRSMPPGLVRYSLITPAGRQGWKKHEADLEEADAARNRGDADEHPAAP